MTKTAANLKISVIIPTLGESRREKLNNLLSDIDRQSFTDREIIVVDGRNGQAGAINEGAARSRGEILFILDDDAGLGHEDLFKNMINVLESDSSIGMVGASTVARPGDSLFQKIALRQIPRRYYPVVDRITESDMAHHPCCAIPKKIFEEVGGENELLIRGLDPDLRFRIRSRGYKVVIAPHSWIYHPLPETLIGIFKMHFRNGRASAFAYKTDPDLICEAPDGFHRMPRPPKTTLTYRVFRFIKRFVWNILTLKIIALISMTAYGTGYIVEFFTYKKPQNNIIKELYFYNIKYFASVLEEIIAIFLKEVLINKNNLFKWYLRDRLVLYDVKDLSEKYASKSIIWVHANTFGDMNAAVRLAKILKTNLSDIVIIASTTEVTAYNITKGNVQEINEIFFLPFDIPFLIKRVFKRLRPKLFISVEVLLWPNLPLVLNKIGIKTILLNGDGRQLDESLARYRIPKKLRSHCLNKLDFFGMRSEQGAEELRRLGAGKEKIEITGCFRLDRPIDFPTEEEKDKLLNDFCLSKDIDIIIGGSTWLGAEEIFLKAFKEIIARYPNLVMVLAPRHINRGAEIYHSVLRAGLTPKKRSLFGVEKVKRGEVIILDTIGELYELYGIAKLSIIGDSFINVPGGGTGIGVEPLLRGSPIIIGPYTQQWNDLAEEMNLTRVYDYKELRDALIYFLDNPERAIDSRDFALKIISKYKGSFARCAEVIEKMLFSKNI